MEQISLGLGGTQQAPPPNDMLDKIKPSKLGTQCVSQNFLGYEKSETLRPCAQSFLHMFIVFVVFTQVIFFVFG